MNKKLDFQVKSEIKIEIKTENEEKNRPNLAKTSSSSNNNETAVSNNNTNNIRESEKEMLFRNNLINGMFNNPIIGNSNNFQSPFSAYSLNNWSNIYNMGMMHHNISNFMYNPLQNINNFKNLFMNIPQNQQTNNSNNNNNNNQSPKNNSQDTSSYLFNIKR